ncbi:ribonuclease H family protein [Paenibacillus sp. Marseille-Q4541]|uniref:ribonuclease H family protein n=1 Tax=Paenibacillus sp. Marseille-Q4541 TaxID=2831522 RepID=UPI001BA8128C|nr:ribonuclease H family protein [Paenibacillus sp. Marseille-Q4541]
MRKKCFTAWFDGSIDHINQKAYIGYLIISPNNKVIRMYSNEISYVSDIQRVECLALNECLYFANRRGIKDIKVYGDCKYVIADIVSGSEKRKCYKRTKLLRNEFINCELIFKPRIFNKYADHLCKLARYGTYVVQGGKFNGMQFGNMSLG